jgi:hypothetical protein
MSLGSDMWGLRLSGLLKTRSSYELAFLRAPSLHSFASATLRPCMPWGSILHSIRDSTSSGTFGIQIWEGHYPDSEHRLCELPRVSAFSAWPLGAYINTS